MGVLLPSAPASPYPYTPTWAVLERTRQELETLGRTALPPPIGDIKVDLDWPGHPLVAVLGNSQGQCHLRKRENEAGHPQESRLSSLFPRAQTQPPSFFHLLRNKVHSLETNLIPEWPHCLLQKRIGSSGVHSHGQGDSVENLLTSPPLPPGGYPSDTGTSLLCSRFTVASSSHCSFPSVQGNRQLQPNSRAPPLPQSPAISPPAIAKTKFRRPLEGLHTEEPTAFLLDRMEESGFTTVSKVQGSQLRPREMAGPAQGPEGVSDKSNS